MIPIPIPTPTPMDAEGEDSIQASTHFQGAWSSRFRSPPICVLCAISICGSNAVARLNRGRVTAPLPG